MRRYVDFPLFNVYSRKLYIVSGIKIQAVHSRAEYSYIKQKEIIIGKNNLKWRNAATMTVIFGL